MHLSFKLPNETKTHRLFRQDKDAVAENDYDVTLTDVTFLKKTKNDHQIYKATMAGKDVIVKLTFEEQFAIPRLEKESEIYVKYLKPFWGIHVPKFYGFYLYDSDPNELSCACMILQYCGEPAVSDLSRLKDYRGNKQFRNEIMDFFFCLHSPEIKLEHNEIDAAHILDFEGRPFLVDFADAVEHHECTAWEEVENLTREVLHTKEGEILRDIGQGSVECYELWAFLGSVEYWIPPKINFYGRIIKCKKVTSAAYLYQQAIQMRPSFETERQIWNDSVSQWQRIRSGWRKYHPNAAVEPPLGIVDFQEYLETCC